MATELKLSDRQKSVLEELISRRQLDADGASKAQILLDVASGAGEDAAARKNRTSLGDVKELLENWEEESSALEAADRSGRLALRRKLEEFLANAADVDSGDCCSCTEEEEKDGLSSYQIELLAHKVYELLRYELIVERERLGYHHYV